MYPFICLKSFPFLFYTTVDSLTGSTLTPSIKRLCSSERAGKCHMSSLLPEALATWVQENPAQQAVCPCLFLQVLL